jgi:hypothetical protein
MNGKKVSSTLLGLGAVGFAALALLLASLFPAVEGLGTKVRLPVFHGALTWANLTTFSLMAIVAFAYLVRRRDTLYRWETGLRWVSVPMWLVGSSLGLWAALNTWDLSGSQSSAMSVVMSDPRLMAQFWVSILAILLLVMPLLLEQRRLLAVADICFTGIMWFLLLRAILGPGRALHPDSPVMNSPEIKIKLIFVGIFASLTAAAVLVSWILGRRVKPAEDADVLPPVAEEATRA